jgi:hypothetical protein
VFCEFADGPLHVMDVQTGSSPSGRSQECSRVHSNPLHFWRHARVRIESRDSPMSRSRSSERPLRFSRLHAHPDGFLSRRRVD